MTKAEDKRMVAIRIEPELLEWFDAAFPIRGAKQWFFEGALRQLKVMYDAGTFEPPVDLLSITVREVVKDLLSDRPLNERVRAAFCGHSGIVPVPKVTYFAWLDEIAAEAERDRYKRVSIAADWICPGIRGECNRRNIGVQEVCRCGFDRAALEEGGDGE